MQFSVLRYPALRYSHYHSLSVVAYTPIINAALPPQNEVRPLRNSACPLSGHAYVTLDMYLNMISVCTCSARILR
jgi:hypothetical protein